MTPTVDTPLLTIRQASGRSLLSWLPEGRSSLLLAALVAVPATWLLCLWIGSVLDLQWYRMPLVPTSLASLLLLEYAVIYLTYLVSCALSFWFLDRRRRRRLPQLSLLPESIEVRCGRRGRQPCAFASIPLQELGAVELTEDHRIRVYHGTPRTPGVDAVEVPLDPVRAEDRFTELCNKLREALPDGLYSIIESGHQDALASRSWTLAEVFPGFQQVHAAAAVHPELDASTVELRSGDRRDVYHGRNRTVRSGSDGAFRFRVQGSAATCPRGMVFARLSEAADRSLLLQLDRPNHYRFSWIDGKVLDRDGAEIGSFTVELDRTEISFTRPVPEPVATLAALCLGNRHQNLQLHPEPDAPFLREPAVTLCRPEPRPLVGVASD